VVAAEAVGVAVEGEHDRAVQEPVEEGSGDGGIAEDLTPRNWNWLRFLIAVRPFHLLVSVSGASA
jgi:hypothetical protein